MLPSLVSMHTHVLYLELQRRLVPPGAIPVWHPCAIEGQCAAVSTPPQIPLFSFL
ncbi:hypothetical protein JB92DRAFT_2851870 [Gautieria morchelliformis]|nr:hypothetical protein JB92DRAFT_2851870 [Gautieria morchelliformis]